MKKRQRSDTSTAEVTAYRSVAAGAIQPPDHVKLREGDWPYWDDIVCARARESWNNADLDFAANLAACKADAARLIHEIAAEGDIVVNQRGTQIMNPKHSLLETLSRRAVALSRMLHVHAEATQGESRDQSKRKKTEDQARKNSEDLDDGLIAPPVH